MSCRWFLTVVIPTPPFHLHSRQIMTGLFSHNKTKPQDIKTRGRGCLSENAISAQGPFRADAHKEPTPPGVIRMNGMTMFIFLLRENRVIQTRIMWLFLQNRREVMEPT